jgi:5,10-methylenetetrahydromethanopterin reductase
VNEGRGDALACAQAIALATSTIKVGTNIANIYFRHPFLAAMSAWTISELSDGRLILGLGISHRRMVESLGIDMHEPREYLRSYVKQVKEGPGR